MSENTQPGTEIVPNTDYFELESPTIGARFAVWVTRPLAYDAMPDAQFPVVYVTDGNIATGVTAPYAVLYGADLVIPMRPYIQVSVGYAGMGVMEANIVRNRDFVPPGEPIAASVTEAFDAGLAAGMIPQEQYDQIMAILRNPHADAFLEWIENDLHAAVTERYRVAQGRHALFGYSYGGLFSLYAFVRQSPLFHSICAGSPAIFGESRITDLFDELVADGASFDDVRLFLTVNERELNGPAPAYNTLAKATLAFADAVRAADLPGLTIATRTVEEESHVSGLTASYLHFIRGILTAS